MANLTIEIPSELQKRIEKAAAEQSVPLDSFVRTALERAALPDVDQTSQPEKPFWATASPQERAKSFLEWARSHKDGPGWPAVTQPAKLNVLF